MQEKHYNGVYMFNNKSILSEEYKNKMIYNEIINSIDTFDSNIFNKTMNNYNKINRTELINILHKLKSKRSHLNYNYNTKTSLLEFIIYSFFVIGMFISLIYLLFITNEINRQDIKYMLRNKNNIHSNIKIDIVLTPKLLLINIFSLSILISMLLFIIHLVKTINAKYPIKYFIRNKIKHIDKMISIVDSKITDNEVL